jgi:hypothetical protein
MWSHFGPIFPYSIPNPPLTLKGSEPLTLRKPQCVYLRSICAYLRTTSSQPLVTLTQNETLTWICNKCCGDPGKMRWSRIDAGMIYCPLHYQEMPVQMLYSKRKPWISHCINIPLFFFTHSSSTSGQLGSTFYILATINNAAMNKHRGAETSLRWYCYVPVSRVLAFTGQRTGSWGSWMISQSQYIK